MINEVHIRVWTDNGTPADCREHAQAYVEAICAMIWQMLEENGRVIPLEGR